MDFGLSKMHGANDAGSSSRSAWPSGKRCVFATSRDSRAEQLRLRRFLTNEAVTVAEMVSHRAMFVAAAAKGRHVLAIQDTSEINYQVCWRKPP